MKQSVGLAALAQLARAETATAVPPKRASLTSLSSLVEAKLLVAEASDTLGEVAERYAIAITPDMADLIDTEEPQDPIAAQFVPSFAELDRRAEESDDPISDLPFSPLPGLVHRYADRVLLKMVSVCPVYCRFCFRREMVGPGGESLIGEDLAAAIAYIKARPQIFEVVVTGGDPFMLSPRRIKDLTQRLAEIDHVKVIRWHTRVPIVDPDRVTDELACALKADGISTWVAIHANHAREFTPKAAVALTRLRAAGVALVSQSVLLKGVNDTVEALSDLMRTFLCHGVKPYYLHHPDLAPGTSHFRNSIKDGQALVYALRKAISGLAQPTYVIDAPGGAAKIPLTQSYIDADDDAIRLLGADDTWVDYKG